MNIFVVDSGNQIEVAEQIAAEIVVVVVWVQTGFVEHTVQALLEVG